MSIIKLGFKVTSNIHVSDPCSVEQSDACSGCFSMARLIPDCKFGEWICHARVINMDEWGDRVEYLKAFHADYEEEEKTFNWQKIGSIGVDSGQVGFFDSKRLYELKDSIEVYEKCCELTQEEDVNVFEGLGVVSVSGFGDGFYEIFTCKHEGATIGLKIVFITEKELQMVENLEV